MIIKNTSNSLVHIEGKTIFPGDEEKFPNAVEKLPAISCLVSIGQIEISHRDEEKDANDEKDAEIARLKAKLAESNATQEKTEEETVQEKKPRGRKKKTSEEE